MISETRFRLALLIMAGGLASNMFNDCLAERRQEREAAASREAVHQITLTLGAMHDNLVEHRKAVVALAERARDDKRELDDLYVRLDELCARIDKLNGHLHNPVQRPLPLAEPGPLPRPPPIPESL